MCLWHKQAGYDIHSELIRTEPISASIESERSDYGRFVTIILNWMVFDCSPHTQHF